MSRPVTSPRHAAPLDGCGIASFDNPLLSMIFRLTTLSNANRISRVISAVSQVQEFTPRVGV